VSTDIHLGFNPATTTKRLGDGFYEQQLIALTGHSTMTPTWWPLRW